MEALKMESRRDNWNDDRLDELSRRMDNGFEAVDRRMERGFNAAREEMSELRADMRHLNERFDRLYYLVLVTIIGSFGSLLANGVLG